jgi:hypothetical protein
VKPTAYTILYITEESAMRMASATVQANLPHFRWGAWLIHFDPNSSDERPRDKDIITSVTKGGS